MLWGFFGNLIFAIIARMLCGNHLNLSLSYNLLHCYQYTSGTRITYITSWFVHCRPVWGLVSFYEPQTANYFIYLLPNLTLQFVFLRMFYFLLLCTFIRHSLPYQRFPGSVGTGEKAFDAFYVRKRVRMNEQVLESHPSNRYQPYFCPLKD